MSDVPWSPVSPSPDHERYAALDIETNGVDPLESQTVAIGVGVYDVTTERCETNVVTVGAVGGDERRLIERAYGWIDARDPTALVTYNGDWFDLPYLATRLDALDATDGVSWPDVRAHVDLFVPRKRAAEARGRKWPRLEEALDACGLAVPETTWEGEPLTNGRFGEELAPAYLAAIERVDRDAITALEAVIDAYTVTDVEATVALYESDVGRPFVPTELERASE